jgi:hypothetical protein
VGKSVESHPAIAADSYKTRGEYICRWYLRGEGGGKPAPSAININKPCKDIKTNGGGRWVSFSKAKHRTKKMKQILLTNLVFLKRSAE